MATAPQILANRENARSSSGPRTPEGKSRSAANATRHGLTGAFAVLSSESATGYEELLLEYQNEFHPDGPHESFLVSQMAESRWRMLRIGRLENRAIEQALETDQADPDAAILEKLRSGGADLFNLLGRYRASAEKSYYKAHKELTEARSRRTHEAADEARRDAAALRQEAAEAERALIELISAPPPVLRNEPNLPRSISPEASGVRGRSTSPSMERIGG